MNLDNDVFILVVALLIVVGICLGLLITLAIFFLGRRGSSSSSNQNIKMPDYHDWLGENETLKKRR